MCNHIIEKREIPSTSNRKRQKINKKYKKRKQEYQQVYYYGILKYLTLAKLTHYDWLQKLHIRIKIFQYMVLGSRPIMTIFYKDRRFYKIS